MAASYAPLPEGKVRLVSGDGFEFIIDNDAARVSTTIRGMLDSEGELPGGGHVAAGLVQFCSLERYMSLAATHPAPVPWTCC